MTTRPERDWTVPRAFQDEDVWVVHRKFNGRALVAWDMGLGKSFGSTLYAHKFLKAGSVVVVCPATIKLQWANELREHFGSDSTILDGKKSYALTRKPGLHFYIINYDILGVPKPRTPTWCRELQKLDPVLVIIDEVVLIKNEYALRTRACKELARGVPHLLGLSGTAGMNNRPIEMLPFLRMARPEVFSSRVDFGCEYCTNPGEEVDWEFRGANNLEKLNSVLRQTLMVRRRKKDVLDQLPPKIRTAIPLALSKSDYKQYARASNDFLQWLNDISPALSLQAQKAEELTRLGYLRRLAARLKLPLVIDWVRNFLETTDEKIILFAVHRAVLDAVCAQWPTAARIDGSITGRHRQGAIDRFNAIDSCRVMAANSAGIAGWSCRSASNVAFAEMFWTPGEHLQAEARVEGIRRGTGRVVNANYLVAEGTIEVDMCRTTQRKQGILEVALDGELKGELSIFDEVIRSIRERGKL